MTEGTGKTVLIVDDDRDMRDIIKVLVASRGHAPILAESGPIALELLETRPQLDLLILDLMMPGMDGYETLAKIRSQGLQELPVIILTARSNDEDLIRGYAVGADFYLVKPFKNETLLNTVDYLIGDLRPEEKAALERRL